MSPSDLDGRRALVLGLGRFSGGVETVRFLRARGADVVVSDAAPRETLAAQADEVEGLGATLVFGAQTPELLVGRDLVVASPAVPFQHPVLEAAWAAGLPVTSEINLLLERVRAPVLGVTGTKGKSTTSTLLAAILEAAGYRVHLGGNVGRALIAEVDHIAEGDVVVLELSSFQLWWADRIARSPTISVLTNLFPDHLNRHGTFEAYAAAKRAAFAHQGPDDVAVLPAGDAAASDHGFPTAGRARRVTFGIEGDFDRRGAQLLEDGAPLADVTGLALWGEHNLDNALAAAAAARQLDRVDGEAVRRGVLATRPLPHRLAPVAEIAGVLFVDDSNATNPTSTRRALESVPRPPVVLVGGQDKGLDPAPLIEALVAHARAVVGIGTTGPDVVRRLGGRIPAVPGGDDLFHAVEIAATLARPGDAVLLSPAYASFDQYPSFVARGIRFQEAVAAWGRTRMEA